ncbi:hypothetical protein DMA11_15390 [Marinilabiliaceae bacterium JC017]|nr:hypothetical protein DMA11_15390 [Marinilabiliaceae bacterium JC017]
MAVYILGIVLGFVCCVNNGGNTNIENIDCGPKENTSNNVVVGKELVLQQRGGEYMVIGNELSSFLKYKNKEQLIGAFGEEQVVSHEIWLEEGTVRKELSILNEGTIDEVRFIWEEAGPFISISGDSSKWHTTKGVKLGMSISELVKLNAAPFKFCGFGCCSGGTIVFDEGVLKNKALKLEFGIPEDSWGNLEWRKLMDDRFISSSSVIEKEIDLKVKGITIQ